jgi:hypothetical protein
MAAPADITPTGSKAPVRDDARQQLNNAIAALRAICTKLDADAGVTDTNYFSLIVDSAATLATPPAKVL